MINIRFFLILIFAIFMVELTYAEREAKFFDISEVGTSATTIRRGDVYGFSSFAHGLFENPASLYRIYKLSISAFETRFMGDFKYQNFALALRMPVGVLGIGMMQLGVSDIHRSDEIDSGELVSAGTFGYQNSVYKLVYQVSQSRYLHLGMTANLYRMQMDTVEGTGINMEFGFVLDGDNVDVSIVLRNVIESSNIHYVDSGDYSELADQNDVDEDVLSSHGRTESLPLISVIGARYRLKNAAFYGQVKTLGDSRKYVKNFGFEFKLPFISILEFSTGYREYYKEAVMIESKTSEKVIQSGTIGVGLNLYGVNFDYAFEKTFDNIAYSSYQQKHYFSVGFSL